MRTLEFNVDKQHITKSGDFSNIIAGSKGYLRASFVFSGDWDGCSIIAAFYDVWGNEFATFVNNGACDIPDEVTNGRKFTLRLMGVKNNKYQIMTNDVAVFQKEVW